MLTNGAAAALTTRSSFTFSVQAANSTDEPALAEFFTHAALDDLRFRFLSGCRTVSHDQLVTMTRSDDQTENFLAFVHNGTLIATAMLACDAARE